MQWDNDLDFDAIERAVADAADRAALLAGEHVLTESRRLVPHEEGTLERSGKVDTERQGDVSVAAISYDTPYAVRQHEEMDYRHDEGRQAKYLEQPLESEQDTVRAIGEQQLRQALK